MPVARDPAFFEEAGSWIRGHVHVTGPIVEPREVPWSVVLRVPTADGAVWFKSSHDDDRFEAALTVRLARLDPGLLPEPIAIDAERGWLLLRDVGVRLREHGESVEDWEAILPRYAELQLAAAPQADELLSLGVPDERLAGLPTRLDRLLDDPAYLLLDRPDGMSSEERDRLRAQLPAVVEMCGELASTGIPETVQHDDLHGGAVLVDADRRHRVIDWGDACISHPFHTLTVLLRATAYQRGYEPGGAEIVRMRDAYLEAFGRFGSRDELVAWADLAYRTGTLARSLAWYRGLRSWTPQERAEEVDTIPYGLQRFLEHGPLGTWRWD
jgi:hypothetical protein